MKDTLTCILHLNGFGEVLARGIIKDETLFRDAYFLSLHDFGKYGMRQGWEQKYNVITCVCPVNHRLHEHPEDHV